MDLPAPFIAIPDVPYGTSTRVIARYSWKVVNEGLYVNIPQLIATPKPSGREVKDLVNRINQRIYPCKCILNADGFPRRLTYTGLIGQILLVEIDNPNWAEWGIQISSPNPEWFSDPIMMHKLVKDKLYNQDKELRQRNACIDWDTLEYIFTDNMLVLE